MITTGRVHTASGKGSQGQMQSAHQDSTKEELRPGWPEGLSCSGVNHVSKQSLPYPYCCPFHDVREAKGKGFPSGEVQKSQ